MYIEYVWYVYLTISIHILSTYFYLLSDLISLPQIYRGTKGNISMNDKSIVDIDEEGHFLIPAGINNIHSLQLFGQTYILFKFITASNSFVIHFLSEIMVKLELQFFLPTDFYYEKWCQSSTSSSFEYLCQLPVLLTLPSGDKKAAYIFNISFLISSPNSPAEA